MAFGAAAAPTPTPTAPPDLVASYRTLCERVPQDVRDTCLLGIVEQLGWLVDEQQMLEVCKAITDPLHQGICYGVARSDPTDCAGIHGEGAALEQELCIGRVSEILCFRGPPGQDRDACLMGYALKFRGTLSLGLPCASIEDGDQRNLCYALVATDPHYCDKITDASKAADCRRQVQLNTSPGATASPSVPAGGHAWSGSFPAVPGSTLQLVLGANGQLTGSGFIPVSDNPALSGLRLSVTSSSGGPDSWSGDMAADFIGKDGKVQMDPLTGLMSSGVVGWHATRSGDGLVGTVDIYGDFDLVASQ
jgi:hypothetical protein